MPTMQRRRSVWPVLTILVGCLLSTVTTTAQDLRGRVVAVADGDTLTVLDASKQQHRVRLNGIDAPETRQPFSQVSKDHLSSLVFGQDVIVVGSKLDRYGRLIGTVILGTTNTNLEQLRAGLAWYYREYAADVAPVHRPIYEATEAEARAAKRGLWRDPQPIAPWAFRSPTAAPTTAAPLTAVGSTPTAAPAGTIRGNRNSRIYHLPGCPSYDAVGESNRVPFPTEAAAQAAGYRKAGNCP